MKRVLIAGSVVIAVIIILMFFNYDFTSVAGKDGYIFGNDKVLKNLSKSTAGEPIELERINFDDNLYSRGNGLFVGEQRDVINTDYPMISEDGSALMFFDDSAKIINDDFTKLKTYEKLVLVDGIVFNQINERTDVNTYLFAELDNGLHVNSKNIEIDWLRGNSVIYSNSFIKFYENKIRFYENEEGTLELGEIDNTYQAIVTIDGVEYEYLELLSKLGIEFNNNGKAIIIEPEIVEPEVIEIEKTKEEEVAQEQYITETIKNNDANRKNWKLPAAPGNAAAAIPPQEILDSLTKRPPVVKILSTDPWVYDIKGNISIEDPDSRIYQGVRLEVYKDGRIFARSIVRSSCEFTVGPLMPDTEYELRGAVQYWNKNDERQELEFYPLTKFTTLPIEGNVYPIPFEYEIDEYNKSSSASFINMKFGEDEETLNDVVPYASKMQYKFEKDGTGDIENCNIGSSELNYLKIPRTINWETPSILDSKSTYSYNIELYDIYGNELAIEDDSYATGTISTCALEPEAEMKVTDKIIGTTNMSIEITNEDNIFSENMIFSVYGEDGEKKEVSCEVTHDDDTVETLFAKDIVLYEGMSTLVLNNLAVGKVFEGKVIADYDILDGKGTVREMTIGDITFGTLRLDELGYVEYDMTAEDITDSSAKIVANMSSTVNDSLAKFISDINFSIYDDEENKLFEYEIKKSDVERLYDDDYDGVIVLQSKNSTENQVGVYLEVEDASYFDDGVWEAIIDGASSSAEYASMVFDFPEDDYPSTRGENDWLIPQERYLCEIETLSNYGGEITDITGTRSKVDFQTLKKEPYVYVDTYLSSEDVVEFFGLNIMDEQSAIVSTKVSARLYNLRYDDESESYVRNEIVRNMELDTNYLYPSLRFENLEEQSRYELVFVASEFNNGYTLDSFQNHYELKSTLFFKTEDALEASIQLESLYYKYTNINDGALEELVDISDITIGEYLDSNGKSIESSGSAVTGYIPVTPGKTYLKATYSSRGVCYYNEQYQFVRQEALYTGIVAPQDGEIFVRMNGNASYFQFFSLREYEEENVIGDNLVNPDEFIDGKYLSFIDGLCRNSSSYSISDYFDVSPGAFYVSYAYASGGYSNTIVFYDRYKKFVGTNRGNSYGTSMFKAPSTAVYARVSCYQAHKGSVDIRAYGDSPDGSSYKATMSININDVNNEVSLRPYKVILRKADGADGEYPEEGTEIYGDIIEVDNDGDSIEINKNVVEYIDSNSTYKIGLYIDVSDGKTILLDEIEFSTDGEIITLESQQDMLRIPLDIGARYIAANDITVDRRIMTSSSFLFRGDLDFNGYKLTIDNVDRIFYGTHKDATIRNMEVDWNYDIENTESVLNSFSSLVYSNRGTISDVIININIESSLNNYVGGISSFNYGTIENFVVRLNDDFKGNYCFGGVSGQNMGTIRNGYIYGDEYVEGIETKKRGLQTALGTRTTYIGGICGLNRNTIKNVFSLIDVQAINTADVKASSVATLVGYNNTEVSNGFTTGDRMVYNDEISSSAYDYSTSKEKGPSIDVSVGRNKITNISYFSDIEYSSTIASKTSETVLWDYEWYKNTINTQSQFEVDSNVLAGFYPRVILPDKLMAKQGYIKLPTVEDADVPTVISALVSDQKEDYALATITMENPQNYRVLEVGIDGLDCEIIDQYQELEGKEFYRVEIEVSNPTKFISSYDLTEILCITESGQPATIDFGAGTTAGVMTLDAKFFKSIYTEEEWSEIDYDAETLKTNYRLKADLDFSESTVEDMRIKSNFYGEIDGGIYDDDYNLIGMYSLNNMVLPEDVVDSDKSIIYRLNSGVLSNVKINGFETQSEGASSYAGFIYLANNGAVVDNVHLDDCAVKGSLYVGSIVAYGDNIIISNSSVKHSTVESFYYEGRILRLGGIAGRLQYSEIRNSFVHDMSIRAISMGSSNGIGGIIGESRITCVEKCYATGKIDSAGVYTGGIVGNNYNSWGNDGNVEKCIGAMNITSTTEYIGGIIGYSSYLSYEYSTNNIAIGNLYTRIANPNNMNRITGNPYPIGSDTIYSSLENNFAYENQIMNGIHDETNLYDALEIFSYDEMLLEDTYVGLIGIDDGYDYSEISEGKIPYLYNTSGELLENQEDYYLNDINIEMEVLEIETPPEEGIPFTLAVKVTYPDSYDNYNIEFESDNAQVFSVTNTNVSDEVVIYNIEMQFDYYYDSYLVRAIIDDIDNEITTILQKKVDLFEGSGLRHYKEIANIGQWQSYFADGDNANAYENIMITGDIDFGEVTDPIVGVKVNRLVGEADKGYKIQNLDYDTEAKLSATLVSEVTSYTGEISFENIAFTTASTSNTTRTRYAVIGDVLGAMNNVNFNNITLQCRRANYIAPVGKLRGSADNVSAQGIIVELETSSTQYISSLFGYAQGELTNIDVSDFDIDAYYGYYVGGIVGYLAGGNFQDVSVSGTADGNSTITSRYCTGGVVGNCQYMSSPYAQDIEVRDVDINTIYSYTGGVAGYAVNGGNDDRSLFENVIVDNCNINGMIYTGGVFGYRGKIINASIGNTNVTGTKYVGGGAGYGGSFTDLQVQDSNITGQEYVGGLSGAAKYQNTECLVAKCEIKGNEYVGGAFGVMYLAPQSYTPTYTRDLKVVECKVTATAENDLSGNNVGGIAGKFGAQNMQNSFVLDTNVTGENNVGGIAGLSVCGTVERVYSNANVTGSVNVGGLFGKLESYDWSMRRVMQVFNSYSASTISGTNYVGGLAGTFEKDDSTSAPETILEENFANILITGDIACSESRVSLLANREAGEYTVGTASNFRVYKNLKVNGSDISSMQGEHTFVGLDELENPDFYLDQYNMNWDSQYWCTDGLNRLSASDMLVSADSNGDVYLYVEDADNVEGVVTITKNSSSLSQTAIGNFENGYAKISFETTTFGVGMHDLNFTCEVNGLDRNGNLGSYEIYDTSSNGPQLDILIDGTATNNVCFQTEPVNADISVSGTTETYSVQWYKNSHAGGGGVAIDGANSSSLDLYGRGFYYAELTFNPSGDKARTASIVIDEPSYMPYLKSYVDSNRPVITHQEGYDINGNLNSVTDAWYKGGVKAPDVEYSDVPVYSVAKSMMMMTTSFASRGVSLPVPTVYPSGVDTINIEFDSSIPYDDEDYKSSCGFIISNNGVEVLSSDINKRVYTVTYDFKSNMDLIITDGVSESTYDIDPEDLRRTVVTKDNEYYYINDYGIRSSQGQILGTFVNINENKAMTADGTIIDMDNNGSICGGFSRVSMVETQPWYNYADTILTYKNFSATISNDKTVINEIPLAVKNGELKSINSHIDMVFDSFILDEYGDNDIYVVLGEDGKLTLLKGKIELPDDFINREISHITNTLNTDEPIVMVRYDNNQLVAFNYLTGELIDTVDVSSDASLIEYAKDFVTNLFQQEIVSASDGYIAMEELKEMLTVYPVTEELDTENVEKSDVVADGDNSKVVEKEGSVTNADKTVEVATGNGTGTGDSVESGESEETGTATNEGTDENVSDSESETSGSVAEVSGDVATEQVDGESAVSSTSESSILNSKLVNNNLVAFNNETNCYEVYNAGDLLKTDGTESVNDKLLRADIVSVNKVQVKPYTEKYRGNNLVYLCIFALLIVILCAGILIVTSKLKTQKE